jgi:hypothetical protein
MSVFGNRNYAQQPVARTPGFGKAAQNSAYVQNINNQNKRRDKQENLQGMGMVANSLREGGMLGGAKDAFKSGYAGSPAMEAMAPAAGATTGALGGAGAGSTAGAAIPGASFGLGANAAAGGAAATGAATGGGVAAGAGAALASNPVGWAAMAALAAYSLFG